jgi:hypothetical protein
MRRYSNPGEKTSIRVSAKGTRVLLLLYTPTHTCPSKLTESGGRRVSSHEKEPTISRRRHLRNEKVGEGVCY